MPFSFFSPWPKQKFEQFFSIATTAPDGQYLYEQSEGQFRLLVSMDPSGRMINILLIPVGQEHPIADFRLENCRKIKAFQKGELTRIEFVEPEKCWVADQRQEKPPSLFWIQLKPHLEIDMTDWSHLSTSQAHPRYFTPNRKVTSAFFYSILEGY